MLSCSPTISIYIHSGALCSSWSLKPSPVFSLILDFLHEVFWWQCLPFLNWPDSSVSASKTFRFQTGTRHQSNSLFDFLPPHGQVGSVVAKQQHLQVSQLAEVDLEYWIKTRECPQKENSNWENKNHFLWLCLSTEKIWLMCRCVHGMYMGWGLM